MWPVSPGFLDSLRNHHRPICRVDVYREGLPVETDLPIADGSITLSLESNVRGTVDLTLPQAFAGAVDPYVSDLRVKMGLAFPDGRQEFVPMGVFRAFTSSISRPGGEVKVQGADWGELVAASNFIRPTAIGGGVRVTDAISSILQDGYAQADVVNRSTSDDQTTHRAIYDTDRWEAINSLSDSIDANVFFDREGNAVIEDHAPGDPVWEIDTGENGVLVEYAATLSRDGQANIVVCYGDNPNGGKAWAKAEDNDPDSPTRVDSWYGNRVLHFSNQAWTTKEKCRKAANKKLSRYSGLAQTVDLSSVPNPALDPGDVVSLRFYSGQRETHEITGISLNLGPAGPMKLATRLKRVTED